MQRTTRLLWSTTSLLTALSMMGCLKEESPPVSQTQAAIQASDSAQMWKLYSAWAKTHPGGGAMQLDFANDTHFRVIQNRLRTAGKDPANSPELFARLDGARLKARAAAARGVAAEPETEPWCGQGIPFGNAVTGQYTASSMFGCTDGSDYSYADVTASATTTALEEFLFLESVSNEDFASEESRVKFLQTERLTGRAEPAPGRILFMDSITVAFDDVNDFAGYEPVLAANAVPDRPASLTINHPREIQGNAPDNPIRACLFREHIQVGRNQDCDYGTVLKNGATLAPFNPLANGMAAAIPTAANVPWTPDANAFFAAAGQLVPQNGSPVIAYLPLQGTYDAGAANLDDCTNELTSGKAQLFLLQTGGTCQATTVSGTVKLPWVAEVEENAVWAFRGLVDFGATCLRNLQDVKMTITVTNDRGSCGLGRGKTIEVSPIDFRNSCIAEGSLVALGSGKTVPVEKLAIGDKVVANARGSVLTVQAISRGFEPFAMVQLRDDKGNTVKVTSKHPMLLETGSVIAADKLAVGDKVRTRKGATRLVAVDRVKHEGEVFNFVLGTEKELASLGPDDRTLFANGFLVGDSVMQHRLENQERAPATVASRVRSEWRRDYEHAVARKTIASR